MIESLFKKCLEQGSTHSKCSIVNVLAGQSAQGVVISMRLHKHFREYEKLFRQCNWLLLEHSSLHCTKVYFLHTPPSPTPAFLIFG